MNVDELVVLTYPRHMFITCLTIREAIKWQKWDKPVTVLYDDMFHPQYVTYCDDLQEQIKKYIPSIELNLIPYSRLGILQHHIILKEPMKYGWIRQQLVKLYLDQLLDTNKWFILDSDCVLMQNIPYDINVYARTYNYDELSVAFQNYWNYMYKDIVNIKTKHPSNPVPFRYLERELLIQMREYISKLHNKSFIQIHHLLLDKKFLIGVEHEMVMSEWDLIEYYRNNIYQQSSNMNNMPVQLTALCKKDNYGDFVIRNDLLTVGTFYGNDSVLGHQWFLKNNIEIDIDTYTEIIKNWIGYNSEEYYETINSWNSECE